MFSDESVSDKGTWKYGYGAVQAAASMSKGGDSMCLHAVLAVWERQASMEMSAVALVELVTVPLSPPFCLCRRLQQGSFPPAIPVAGDECKHLGGPPAHGDY